MNHVTKRVSLLTLIVALALVAVTGHGLAVGAEAPEEAPDNWAWEEYANQSPVHALAREGNLLWAGTEEGVIRFDLTTHAYQVYTEEISGNFVTSIHVDAAGVKWFGTDGDSLWRFDGETWDHYYAVPSYIRAIVGDPQGHLLLATWDGVYRFNGTTATFVPGGPYDDIEDVAVDPAGRIWAATDSGTHMYDGSQWVFFDDTNTGPGGNVQAVSVDSAGDVWFAIYYVGVGRWSNGDWTLWTDQDGLPNEALTDISADSGGDVWVATGSGAARYNSINDWWYTYGEEEGIPTHGVYVDVHVVLAESPGIGWVGTDLGATRIDNGGAVDYVSGPRIGSQAKISPVTITEQGTVWAAITGLRGLYSYDGIGWAYHTKYDGLPGIGVLAMAVDLQGNLWVATMDDNMPAFTRGIARYDGQTWHSYEVSDGIHTLSIRAIEVADNGDVWFGGYNGLSRFDGTTWSNYGQSGEPVGSIIETMAVDGSNVWMGFESQEGLTRFDGTDWTTFTTADGMANASVYAVDVDSQGRVWIGTPDGLSMYDGTDWSNFDVDDGLADGTYREIVVDPLDRVWALSGSNLSIYEDGSWNTYANVFGSSGLGSAPAFSQSGSTFWTGGQSLRQVFLLDQFSERVLLPAVR